MELSPNVALGGIGAVVEPDPLICGFNWLDKDAECDLDFAYLEQKVELVLVEYEKNLSPLFLDLIDFKDLDESERSFILFGEASSWELGVDGGCGLSV